MRARKREIRGKYDELRDAIWFLRSPESRVLTVEQARQWLDVCQRAYLAVRLAEGLDLQP